ncbi:MAG TPA: hypothetical protein VF142_20985 [Longimicrobium sp.]
MRMVPAAALCTLCVALSACQDVENVVTAGIARIQVQNLRQSVLQSVYTPPCGGGDLGPDRLRDRSDVAPGSMNDFSIVPGCYDVVGDFADGSRRTVEDVRTYPDVQSRVIFDN